MNIAPKHGMTNGLSNTNPKAKKLRLVRKWPFVEPANDAGARGCTRVSRAILHIFLVRHALSGYNIRSRILCSPGLGPVRDFEDRPMQIASN